MSELFYYKLYDKRVVSDYALPQLVTLSDEEKKLEPEVRIRQGIFPEELKKEQSCWSEITRPVALLSNNTCYLYVTADEIVYEPRKDSTTPQYLGSYLLGWGVAMLFWERKELSIHCSCVANKDGAVIISGRSGAGKSTVTAFFLDNGYRLMADDVSVCRFCDDGVYATPAFPAQKFCRDVAVSRNLNLDELIYIDEDKDKFLVPYKGEFLTEPVKVRQMIFLSSTEGIEKPTVAPASGLQKFFMCRESLFLKPLLKSHIDDSENSNLILKFASYFPLYSICRPNGIDTHSEVEQILKTLI